MLATSGNTKKPALSGGFKVVGPIRFESTEGQSHTSESKPQKTDQIMHTTSTATSAPNSTEADSLRQQLAESDQNRRRLLCALFLKHEGETGPILEMLFSTAPTATLARIETILAEGVVS